jgi:hypothetical protein
MPLSAAVGGNGSEVSACTALRPIGCVEAAAYVAEEDDVNSVLARIDERPVLVTSSGQPKGRLVGILTSFDLL